MKVHMLVVAIVATVTLASLPVPASAALSARTPSGLLFYYALSTLPPSAPSSAPAATPAFSSSPPFTASTATFAAAASSWSSAPPGLAVHAAPAPTAPVTTSADILPLRNRFAAGQGYSLEVWFTAPPLLPPLARVLDVSAGVFAECDVDSPVRIRVAGSTLVTSIALINVVTPFCTTITSPAGVIVPGEPHSVVVSVPSVASGARISVYVNDVLVSSDAAPETAVLSGPAGGAWDAFGPKTLTLGSGATGLNPFVDAVFHQLAFYNHPLTALERAANYAAGPYNSPPVALPTHASGPEDTDLVVVLAASDPDPVDADRLVFTLTSLPSPGTLYTALDVGGSLVRGAPIVAVPATLASSAVIYAAPPDAHGVGLASFLFTVTDGEATSPPAAASLTIDAINDAPRLTAPPPPPATTYAAGLPTLVPGLSVADPEGDTVTLSLAVADGSLALSVVSGLSFAVGSAAPTSLSAVLLFSCAPADCNAALASLTYTAADAATADTLTLRASDASHGLAWVSAVVTLPRTFAVPILAVPAAPATSVAVAATLAPLSVTAPPGTAARILACALEAPRGTLALPALTASGATLAAGVAPSSYIRLTGTAAQISAAWASATYTTLVAAAAAAPAYDTLRVSCAPAAPAASAAAASASATITIAAASAASIALPPAPLLFPVDGTAFVFTPPVAVADADGTAIMLTVSVPPSSPGAVAVADLAGAQLVSGRGSGNAALVLAGSIDQINGALATLTFVAGSNADAASTATIVFEVNDGPPSYLVTRAEAVITLPQTTPGTYALARQPTAPPALAPVLLEPMALGPLVAVGPGVASVTAGLAAVRLSAAGGVFELTGPVPEGVAFSTGSAAGSHTVLAFDAPVASVASVLDSVVYRAVGLGPDAIVVEVREAGTGAGGGDAVLSLDVVRTAAPPGDEGPDSSVIWVVLVFVLLAIVVFCVGVIGFYMCGDPQLDDSDSDAAPQKAPHSSPASDATPADATVPPRPASPDSDADLGLEPDTGGRSGDDSPPPSTPHPRPDSPPPADRPLTVADIQVPVPRVAAVTTGAPPAPHPPSTPPPSANPFPITPTPAPAPTTPKTVTYDISSSDDPAPPPPRTAAPAPASAPAPPPSTKTYDLSSSDDDIPRPARAPPSLE